MDSEHDVCLRRRVFAINAKRIIGHIFFVGTAIVASYRQFLDSEHGIIEWSMPIGSCRMIRTYWFM